MEKAEEIELMEEKMYLVARLIDTCKATARAGMFDPQRATHYLQNIIYLCEDALSEIGEIGEE